MALMDRIIISIIAMITSKISIIFKHIIILIARLAGKIQ